MSILTHSSNYCGFSHKSFYFPKAVKILIKKDSIKGLYVSDLKNYNILNSDCSYLHGRPITETRELLFLNISSAKKFLKSYKIVDFKITPTFKFDVIEQKHLPWTFSKQAKKAMSNQKKFWKNEKSKTSYIARNAIDRYYIGDDFDPSRSYCGSCLKEAEFEEYCPHCGWNGLYCN